jgi:hypothetical protein
MHETASTSAAGEFEVVGEALSFGTIRPAPQDRTILEYVVNGKPVARAYITSKRELGHDFEILTIYDGKGTLLGSVRGDKTSPYLHMGRTFEILDPFTQPLMHVTKSLLLFNKWVFFDLEGEPVALVKRSRLLPRGPIVFEFLSEQPEELHPSFFLFPLVAWRQDQLSGRILGGLVDWAWKAVKKYWRSRK